MADKIRSYTPKAAAQQKRWRLAHPEHKRHYSQAYYRYRHDQIINQFGTICYLCGRNFPKMALHHLSYENGRASQWKYYTQALANPELFKLLCHGCHNAVTVAMHFWQSPEYAERFLECIKVKY